MNKDKNNGMVSLSGARRQVPPGKIYRHHRGDLYRILSHSRQRANPNLIEVTYYEHVPLETPLFPLTLEQIVSVNPWHQQPHEFSEVVPDPELGDLVQRYQPLTFQPESGWGFQINRFVSQTLSLDDAIRDLKKALNELDKLPENHNSPQVNQALAIYEDRSKIHSFYVEALTNGMIQLASCIYVGRHEALGRELTL